MIELKTTQEVRTSHLSGYDLTTRLLRGGLSKFKLNANAKMVLLYLAACYNEKNGVVFPKVTTIAASLDISERGVIRALAELTQQGCIIRSKQGANKNVYVITNKVFETCHNGTTNRQDDTLSNDIVSLPCIEIKQEKIKKQQQSVVQFPKKQIVTNENVPEIIKNDKNIKNPCAYWASLSSEIKEEYLKKQEDVLNAAQKIQEAKQIEETRKQKEKAEFEKLKALPLKDRFTKEDAIRFISNMKPEMRKISKLAAELTALYDLL